MKITDLTLTMIEWTGVRVLYSKYNPIMKGSQIALLTIETDEGVVGQCFLGSSYRTAQIEAWSVINIVKPMILGRNALERTAINDSLMSRLNSTSYRVVGAVDVALWDLAGKVANMPIHQLLGTRQQSLPTYASSATLSSLEAYVDEAIQVKEAGYVGYKTHPPFDIDINTNIKLHQRIRDAVGPDFMLMCDPTGVLKYPEALKLGLAITEMGYHWYEDPLPYEDINGYIKLCAKLDIMVMATEKIPGGLHAYAPWLTLRATDALRGDVVVKGGLTPCLMAAHLANAFHMNYEIHHGGNSTNNIANLHLAMALPNSAMFEVLLPNDAQQFGVLNDLKLRPDGHMRVPDGPGLGVIYDEDLIRHHTVEVLR